MSEKKYVSPSIWRDRVHVERATEMRYGDKAIKATGVEIYVLAPGSTFVARVEEVFAARYHRNPGIIATIGAYKIIDRFNSWHDPDLYDFEPQIRHAVERWARLKLIDWIHDSKRERVRNG